MVQKQIYNHFTKVLKEYGSFGYLYIKLPPTTAPTAKIYNSYDENGNEIEIPSDKLAPNDTFEIRKIKYSNKKLTVKERTELSLSDGAYRFTFIYPTDTLNLKKGDIIEDVREDKFSVEYIDIIGDLQGQKMLYQVIAMQD